jgi:ribosomal protein S18 acetylase RimI-like enzyme
MQRLSAEISARISVEVEQMKPADAGAVSSLFLQVLALVPYYNAAAKAAERARYTATLLRESLLEDPDCVLVARHGADLLGYCFSRQDDGLIWLSWFGVHPDHRQLGIGTVLLKGLEDRARRARAHKVWCDCRTNNTASRLTLIRANFQPLCTVSNHWHGQDFILWEKLVESSN